MVFVLKNTKGVVVLPRIVLLSLTRVRLTHGSQCAPYSRPGRSEADSTVMTSLAMLDVEHLVTNKENVTEGFEVFSSVQIVEEGEVLPLDMLE